jgi:hypothetical protein
MSVCIRTLIAVSVFIAMSTMIQKANAATTASESVAYSLQVLPTITADCPATPVLLGTYDAGAVTANINVDCNVTQNRTSGNLRITSAPASNFINLTNGAATYRVNFSTYSYTGSAIAGSFAAGLTVTNPQRGTRRFRFRARPVSPIPTNTIPGTYTGSRTITFTLL